MYVSFVLFAISIGALIAAGWLVFFSIFTETKAARKVLSRFAYGFGIAAGLLGAATVVFWLVGE